MDHDGDQATQVRIGDEGARNAQYIGSSNPVRDKVHGFRKRFVKLIKQVCHQISSDRVERESLSCLSCEDEGSGGPGTGVGSGRGAGDGVVEELGMEEGRRS